MSKDDRASVYEIENEFNRAMALLTDDPLPSDDVEQILVEIESESESAYALIGSGNVEEDEVTTVKLTTAQREWLESLARNEQEATPDYTPLVKLNDFGFATFKAFRLYTRRRYTITPAGREWLAANPRKT